MENRKTVCYTGHRHIPASAHRKLFQLLMRETERQIHAGAIHFRAGGAIGFDTMAAQAVLKLRESYPDIRLDLILPCPSQTERWREKDIRVYQDILSRADSVRYVSTAYYNGVLQLRNRALVNGSDVCIAYLTASSGGGAAYTSALALREGLTYINLAEGEGNEEDGKRMNA